VFKKRLAERIKYINHLLEQKFDFTLKESFLADREKADWAATNSELDELWRLRLKNDALNMTLAGKEWKEYTGIIIKTLS